MLRLSAITVILIIIGGLTGAYSHINLSKFHPTIKLAEQVMLEQMDPSLETTLASRTFHESGKEIPELLAEVKLLQSRFKTGSIILGIFIGLTIGLKTIGIFFRLNREDYTANRTDCFSCGRCIPYCPDEHERQQVLESKQGLYESIG